MKSAIREFVKAQRINLTIVFAGTVVLLMTSFVVLAHLILLKTKGIISDVSIA